MLLREESQSEKSTYYMIPTICHSGKVKTIEAEKDEWMTRAKERGRMNRQNIDDLGAGAVKILSLILK